VNHLDLFTGIGGFSLAAYEVWGDEHAIVSFCEIDRRCREFLSRTWPGVPCWDDIKTLDATKWIGTVDLLSAGVPCQPASRAGKQKGEEDDRWLWPEALRIVEECKPTWVLFENPPGVQDVGLDGILAELEGKGYEIGILDIPACAVDAPHIRSRLWIVGYSESSTRRVLQQHERSGKSDIDARGSTEGGVADTRYQQSRWTTESERCKSSGTFRAPSRLCWDSHLWLPCADGKVRRAPDDTLGLAHGLPMELLEALGTEGRQTPEDCEPSRSLLGALGNSIVPQVAVEIMMAIKAAMSTGIKDGHD
jgi:DNA (cytosine-5)-methyltransferase 1